MIENEAKATRAPKFAELKMRSRKSPSGTIGCVTCRWLHRNAPMPATATALQAPIVFAVPLQLLAYHVAVLKGTDVDQPRNLAKSLTVE